MVIILGIVCVIIAIPIMLVWAIITGPAKRAASIRAQDKIDGIVGRHAATLKVRRRQLILVDAYGNVERKKWEKEAAKFWVSQIERSLVGYEKLKYEFDSPERNARVLDGALIRCGIDIDNLSPTYVGTDPIDYELYCAELLRSVGWTARTTQGSNDQGSDVIATHGNIRLVVQCKLYSRAVGNGAVQEANAARAHEGAHHAAVVTNSTFTSAARALSQTTGVALLHHEQLQDFADELLKLN